MPKQVSPQFLGLNTTHFQSGQSPKWASVFMVVQNPRLLLHCGSARPGPLKSSPFSQQMGNRGVWNCAGPRGGFHGLCLEAAFIMPTVRTQSTPNCRSIRKCHLVQRTAEYKEVSPTDWHRATCFQGGPMPEEIRDIFRNLVSPCQ